MGLLLYSTLTIFFEKLNYPKGIAYSVPSRPGNVLIQNRSTHDVGELHN